MFSFHKPKVYRSQSGCCICRAKSSSSRFTDSSKYEGDFMDCFKLTQMRSGEICNACVLLVKRWKKLPIGTNRNWHHVVDARKGPGTKASKYRNRRGAQSSEFNKKHRYIKKRLRAAVASAELSDDQCLADERFSETSGHSVPNSLTPSPFPSPYPSDDDGETGESPITSSSRRRKQRTPSQYNYSEFIDFNYWKLERICCGIIFRGALGEVLIDCQYFKPCCKGKVSLSSTATSPSPTLEENSEPQRGFVVGELSDGVSNSGDDLHDYEEEEIDSCEEENHNLLSRFYSSHPNIENERLLHQFETSFPS